MSSMKYTLLERFNGVALKDGQYWKKGDTIPMSVYLLKISTRGGGESESKKYFYTKETPMKHSKLGIKLETKELKQYQRPNGKELALGVDFDFKKIATPIEDTLAETATVLKSKKSYLKVLLFGALAYLVYKKLKK